MDVENTSDLVEEAIRARREAEAAERQSSPSRWVEADAYAALSDAGWSVRLIAERCGTNKDSVSRFIRCSRCIPRDTERPSFWNAYAEVKGGKQERADGYRIEPGPLPEGVFRTVVADPPWRYGNSSTRGAAEDHYPTMTMDELAALDVASHLADQAHLYLWVTNNFLREGFDLVEAWGFDYKTCLTWVKPQMGMGNYFRGSTEHILFGARGGLRTNSRSLVNWFEAPRGKHSAKPDCFYDIVQEASPGPYLELFARRAQLGDWTYWGNEALESPGLVA